MDVVVVSDVIFQRNSCAEKCCLWWELCFCGCCIEREYVEDLDIGLLVQNSSNEHKSDAKTTVQVTSTPDLQYLADVSSGAEPQVSAA